LNDLKYSTLRLKRKKKSGVGKAKAARIPGVKSQRRGSYTEKYVPVFS
jgi:hypothetical protein